MSSSANAQVRDGLATPNAFGARCLACFLLALLTFAAHWPALRGQFLYWDDDTHVTQNPVIRALTWENVRTMFTQPIAKLYVPLTWLSFAVDYQIWGQRPFGYHLTNLLLHVANTVLVFVLVGRLFPFVPVGAASPPRPGQRIAAGTPLPRELCALVTAAIFGVHPLRVESVAWVTERKDVLYTFCYLCALLAYHRHRHHGDNSCNNYYMNCPRRFPLACWGWFVAAGLAKAAAVTLPAVLVLLDLLVLKRITPGGTRSVASAGDANGHDPSRLRTGSAWPSIRRSLMEKLLFLAVSLAVGGATVWAQASGTGETVATLETIPLSARLGLLGYCSLFYVGKFFWPANLSAIYPTFDEMNWGIGHTAGWLLAFVIVAALVVALRRRAPVLGPAGLFYLITLSPTIGLVPVGIHVVADRHAYLPLLGLAFAVGWLLRPQVLAVAVVLGLAVLTNQRSRVWHDTATLFQSVLAENPRCLPAHINLTKWYTDTGQLDQAIAHGRQAVEIAPQGLPGRKNLAAALLKAGRTNEAAEVADGKL